MTIKNYMVDINKNALLTKEETNELFQKYKESGDIKARNKLWESNLKLVVSIAKSYSKANNRNRKKTLQGDIEFEDMVSEGNIGLLTGIEKFDYTKGFALSTYVSWWIKQGIQSYLSRKSKTIRFPNHIVALKNQMMKSIEDYRREFNENPTDEELMATMGITKLTLDTLRTNGEVYSLNSGSIFFENSYKDLQINEKNDSEHLSGEEISPFDSLSLKELSGTIRKAFKNLTKKEEAIVRLRFGISEEINTNDKLKISDKELKRIKSNQLII